MMRRVAVVGSINTDFVVRSDRFPEPGETLIGESFAIYGGGKGANQAIAASRLGAEVEFFGAVGRDANSTERLAALRSDGVGIGNVRTIDGFGGVAVIQVESTNGQNSITLVPGANGAVEAGDVGPVLESWCRPGDVFSQQLEIPLETVRAVLAVGLARGAVNVLNAAPFDERVIAMLPLVDLLIVNEIEAGQILHYGPVRLEDVSSVATEIRHMGVRSAVIVTLGSRGAWLNDDNVNELVPAPVVRAVDTTGAGDAFCGALCAWLARGASQLDAVRAGVIAGSLAVQHHGAQPSLPTLEEFNAAFPPRTPADQ